MTNYEKWRKYTDNLSSPDNFIDFGWYTLIAFALQRCVWIGSEDINQNPLFANPYTILCGPPGVGKGLVITRVSKLARYWKQKKTGIQAPVKTTEVKIKPSSTDDVSRILQEELANETYENAKRLEDKSSYGKTDAAALKRVIEEPLLLPMGPDDTTYQALLEDMGQLVHLKQITKWSESMAKMVPSVYTHSTMNICLEEMASFFNKDADQSIKFLIKAYDSTEYDYRTKKNGRDKIKRLCVSLLAGTQPSFMRKAFSDTIINDGFASRCFFICAEKDRFSGFWLKPLTPAQLELEKELLEHVKKLTTLYGCVRRTPEAHAFCEEWWESARNQRINKDVKMLSYYARKRVGVQKLAMMIHFSDSYEMEIGVEPFKRAIAMLEKEEPNMHIALGVDKNNPMAKPATDIHEYMIHHRTENNNVFTFKELYVTNFASLPPSNDPKEMLSQLLDHLVYTGKIVRGSRQTLSGKTEVLYHLTDNDTAQTTAKEPVLT